MGITNNEPSTSTPNKSKTTRKTGKTNADILLKKALQESDKLSNNKYYILGSNIANDLSHVENKQAIIAQN